MRRKGRELAAQALYQIEVRGESSAAILELFWKQCEAGPRAQEFASSLVAGVAENRERIDELVAASTANWKVERISAVDLSVLRMATFELLCKRDVPTSVVIDEAIEVARRFGTSDSALFVNGVLDHIAATLGVKESKPPEVPQDG